MHNSLDLRFPLLYLFSLGTVSFCRMRANTFEIVYLRYSYNITMIFLAFSYNLSNVGRPACFIFTDISKR